MPKVPEGHPLDAQVKAGFTKWQHQIKEEIRHYEEKYATNFEPELYEDEHILV